MAADEICVISPGSNVHCISKEIPSFRDPLDKPVSIIESFKDNAYAIDGIPTSIDVTGVMDTRTVLALMSQIGVDFETSLSGYKEHVDVRLAYDVSKALDKPFFLSEHRVDQLESELPSVLAASDGLTSRLILQHRVDQMQRFRYDRGI